MGAADIRHIADQIGIHPTKRLGQNFVIDPGTVRRIVRLAGVESGQTVLEVGPGLGSLTVGLLEVGCLVTTDEIDPVLARQLPQTVRERMPESLDRLTVINRDALTLTPQLVGDAGVATDLAMVANLPYNVATPIILTLLARFTNLNRFLVMVQKEVADRLTAAPGSKVYGAPSLKLAWYGHAAQAGRIGRHVFWPTPNVDSALVSFTRDKDGHGRGDEGTRTEVFALIDAAFGQRRKTLHAALKGLVSAEAFQAAGIDPARRGETMTIEEFVALEQARREVTE
ncbi:MAG: 16S rRNA (adenine(1518)-N(6)/adenine(1519)-N(6))-dimethyltransferase RsmA [Bifidobacterium sp.]|nr:16S rRNA (adenine(1518)-N(6)/adenine(1519)-N(6))-dimethyltransferase RsmA [Bifidobacterium sp.]